MALYSRDSKLSGAIMEHPSLIPVVNRLGIDLGVGDGSVAEICLARGVNIDFAIAVINIFVDEDYFPTDASGSFPLEKTIDFLQKTNAYYTRVQLPNIDRHFSMLMQRSGKANNLGMLEKFYLDMREQFSECIRNDDEHLFPGLLDRKIIHADELMTERYAEVEERLHDLLYFFVEHLHGEYDNNLCMAVVSAVFSLERDMCQNNRIRNRILMPLVTNKL